MPRKPNKVKHFVCENCGNKYELRKTPNKGRPKLCGTCLNVDARKRAREAKYYKKPKHREYSREWRLKRYYNLSTSEYEDILKRQNGVCAICKEESSSDNSNYLVVDHSHDSGKVRGLLCDRCNRAIGSLRDNPIILQNAISYLTNLEEDKSWDNYFISIASLVSTRSKDPSNQVGAVLVKDNIILSTGFNGFPRKCDDSKIERYNRPLKYTWTVHAEENALLNAARQGISTLKSTMYITPMKPCSKCVRDMIQSGVTKIICRPLNSNDKWDEDFKIANQMVNESQIEYIEI